MEIKIEKMGINGEGIGYYNKRLMFVLDAYIGEVVVVEEIMKYEMYSVCKVKQVLVKSPYRTHIACQVFSTCHACTLLPLQYDKQLEYKKEMVCNSLMKYSGVRRNIIQEIVANKQVLGYRNSLKLPFSMKDNKLVVGMYQPSSNIFVEVETCVVHEKRLDEMKNEIVRILDTYGFKSYSTQNNTGLRHLVLRGLGDHYQCTIVSGKTKISTACVDELLEIEGLQSIYQSMHTKKPEFSIFGDTTSLLGGSKRLKFKFMNYKLQLSPRSFFQLNTQQAEVLYKIVCDMIPNQVDTIVEAYCGIGVMSLLVSDKAKQVIGIENVKEAVASARRNVDVNKIKNVEFIVGDAGRELVKLSKTKHVDILIVDPPRTGLDETMIDCIIDSKVEKVIYVSCNPSTLAKNLSVLQEYYEIDNIVLVDMFSNTAHVETVVLMSRVDK